MASFSITTHTHKHTHSSQCVTWHIVHMLYVYVCMWPGVGFICVQYVSYSKSFIYIHVYASRLCVHILGCKSNRNAIKIVSSGAFGSVPVHVCACMRGVCCVFADLLLPRPWEWGQSDWTDSLFPNTSVWPAASHTFQYFQTDFQKRELKGIGVVKTWHSQKRAAGLRDYQETSHMTQRCRNDSTARVADEGSLIDIVSLLPFSPLSISVLLPVCHHAHILDHP